MIHVLRAITSDFNKDGKTFNIRTGLDIAAFKLFHETAQKQEIKTNKVVHIMEKRVLGRPFSKKEKISLRVCIFILFKYLLFAYPLETLLI